MYAVIYDVCGWIADYEIIYKHGLAEANAI